MSLGGLVGTATYEGDLTHFVPMLLSIGIAHIGKACTFGNGRVRVSW